MSRAEDSVGSLPPGLADPASRLAAALGRALGWRLVAVYAYGSAVPGGSAVRGGYRPGASDLNVLVVLDQVEAGDLRTVAAARASAGKAPVTLAVLGENDIPGLLASTPLTLLDIHDAHVLLAGRDLLAKATAERETIASQLRIELRDKLAQLRSDGLAAADQPKRLPALLVGHATGLLHALRGLARLAGQSSKTPPDQWAAAIGVEPDDMTALLALARGEAKLNANLAVARLALLLRLIADALDEVAELMAPPAEPTKAKPRRGKSKAKTEPEPEPVTEPQPGPPPPEVFVGEQTSEPLTESLPEPPPPEVLAGEQSAEPAAEPTPEPAAEPVDPVEPPSEPEPTADDTPSEATP